jgi:hypothetical protein
VKAFRAFSASICFMALSCSGPKAVERMQDVAGCYVHWTNGTPVLLVRADGTVLTPDRRTLGVAVLRTIGDASRGRVSTLDLTPALLLDENQASVVVGPGLSASHLITTWRDEAFHASSKPERAGRRPAPPTRRLPIEDKARSIGSPPAPQLVLNLSQLSPSSISPTGAAWRRRRRRRRCCRATAPATSPAQLNECFQWLNSCCKAHSASPQRESGISGDVGCGRVFHRCRPLASRNEGGAGFA